MAILQSLFGDANSRELKTLRPIVDRVNSFEPTFEGLSDVELRGKTEEFKTRLSEGVLLDDILPEAFAVVREAAKRVLGLRHFDVQIMGGVVLHRGNIAEMKTGEGKTLVATLATYLNALSGHGVHVITVNDYLSRRDAVWMGQVYEALDLTVGVVNHDVSFLYDPTHTEVDEERDELGSFKVKDEFLREVTRKEAYDADITYGTNNEFGFDYLRDNISYTTDGVRQRGFAYAIVDEIDSILIDEARTPLIISAPTTESEDLYQTFSTIASKMNKEEDYKIDEKFKQVTLTDAGIEKAERLLGVDNIYTEKGIKYVHHLETAVRAKALYNRDQQYVVKDDQVVLVDEFTGRMMPGKRLSEGMHQAVEAKEGVKVQRESRTFASVTYQNYFRMYTKLAGMTGTAATSSEEFYKVYGLDVVVIPTNKTIARLDQNDQIFQTELGKFKAIARKVKEVNQKGQPVLIGTVSIEKNELLSDFLKKEGVVHEMLNAKNHEREGEIVAQAGRKGAVTIATNMAGRGVDVKLGGSPATPEEYEEVKRLGGLFVLGTERHEARRIDNQLRGRSGRQGDPGETQFFVSLEDSLMRVFASDFIKGVMGRFGIPEDQPIENKSINRSLESAQKKIEGFHFDARKNVLQYDDVLNTQRKTVYKMRYSILFGSQDNLVGYVRSIADGRDEDKDFLLKKAEAIHTSADFSENLRRVVLRTIDLFWVDHLEMMDYMRSSVNLRAYGQRDPLVEYKKEGLRLFKEMQNSIQDEVVSILKRVDEQEKIAVEEPSNLREIHRQANAIAGNNMAVSKPSPQVKNEKGEKIGRNDRVVIEKDGKRQELKWKKAEELVLHNGWKLVK